MYDVMAIRVIPTMVLDTAARLALAGKITGVSGGAGRSVIHLAVADPGDQQIAASVMANIGSLAVNRDTGYINANGSETATITHETDQVSVGYVVTRDKILYSSGTAQAVGGVVTLTLQTNLTGVYAVTIIHPSGIGTGSVEILAV